MCVGGPLLYDSVQLVKNSAALNGTQRVLLDHVMSEEECSDLRHLADVRMYIVFTTIFLNKNQFTANITNIISSVTGLFFALLKCCTCVQVSGACTMLAYFCVVLL